MDYIRNSENGQLVFTQSIEFLRIPSCLYGFMNHTTTTEMTASKLLKKSLILQLAIKR